jgi:hypothetical protein
MSTIKRFLDTLRGTRRTRQSSAEQVYWPACKALAKGEEPTGKATALAEAMDRLGKTEADIERDAQALAELERVEAHAQRRSAARDRLTAAGRAQAAAEREAAALIAKAEGVRAASAAAVAEARGELTAATKAEERAAELRRVLEQRGCPQFAGEAEQRERQRHVEHVEAELRGLATELAEARAAVEGLPVVDADRFAADRAARVRGRLELLEGKRDRLAARLAALKAGAPLDAGDDDGDDGEDLDGIEQGEARTVTP